MKISAILCTALVLTWVGLLQARPVEMVEEDHTEAEPRLVDEYININSKLSKEIRDNLYGGDILLTPEQKEAIEEMKKEQERIKESDIGKRAVVTSNTQMWPDAIVPYTISSSLGSTATNVIMSAIDEFENKTCIRFVPRTTQTDYVDFVNGNGCTSYIGHIGGRQEISIGSGCEFRRTVLHEIFHALGRWHEQSRPDRDDYVEINEENIQMGAENNFEKLSFSDVSTNNIGYDYHSMMHYGAYDFSRNDLPTIEPLSSSVTLEELGQRQTLSKEDLQHALNLYCGGETAPTTAPTTPPPMTVSTTTQTTPSTNEPTTVSTTVSTNGPVPTTSAPPTPLYTGHVQSPDWPETYPVNTVVQWIIECSAPTTRISISLNNPPFSIEGQQSQGCTEDWVKVHQDGTESGTQFGPYCSDTPPPDFEVASNKILILFHAGPEHHPTRAGFKLTFQCLA